MRSDSILITGSTSGKQLERLAQRQNAKKSEKEAKKSTLLPVEEIIFEEIDKIKIENQTEMLGLIGVATDKELVKETLISLKLYGESMERLKTRMKNIIRKRPTNE
jgi:hypothetical protein